MNNRKWKADEMEMAINFKALRISYVFTELGLTLYCIYKVVVSGELPEITLIWLTGVLLFFIFKSHYTRKMTRADDNEE